MPLQHSHSPEAFKSNLKAELAAGKPRDQALAIAYSVKRRGRAAGGSMPAMAPNSPQHLMRAEAQGMHRGPIMSAVPGRTDNHPVKVPAGAFVLPADHISSLGQGNTMAGLAVAGRMFPKSGPYGAGSMPIKAGAGAPRPPRAAGGASDNGGARGEGVGHPVDINAAGGEFVISPEDVADVGRGNIKHGHQILDHWIVSNRKKHIKTLSRLPGPAKS